MRTYLSSRELFLHLEQSSAHARIARRLAQPLRRVHIVGPVRLARHIALAQPLDFEEQPGLLALELGHRLRSRCRCRHRGCAGLGCRRTPRSRLRLRVLRLLRRSAPDRIAVVERIIRRLRLRIPLRPPPVPLPVRHRRRPFPRRKSIRRSPERVGVVRPRGPRGRFPPRRRGRGHRPERDRRRRHRGRDLRLRRRLGPRAARNSARFLERGHEALSLWLAAARRARLRGRGFASVGVCSSLKLRGGHLRRQGGLARDRLAGAYWRRKLRRRRRGRRRGVGTNEWSHLRLERRRSRHRIRRVLLLLSSRARIGRVLDLGCARRAA